LDGDKSFDKETRKLVFKLYEKAIEFFRENEGYKRRFLAPAGIKG
jgi:hypothetical protein